MSQFPSAEDLAEMCPGCKGLGKHWCVLRAGTEPPLVSVVQSAPFSSIADLYEDCEQRLSAEWRDKMLHKVPDAPVVDRLAFILERCKDKNVLNIGSASGMLHESIKNVARQVWGVDIQPGPNTDFVLDVEHGSIPKDLNAQVVVFGEILEHLSNPGRVLEQTWGGTDVEVIITVPNAFHASREWANDGIECVNKDHVAWYSYHTLKTLVERHGYTVQEWAWYNGRPIFAEGLIFVVR